MLGFWETKMRNRKILMYSFAPFLEEAGMLLLAARHLWHPWSVERRNELATISYELRDKARSVRQSGLGWGSNISEFGEDPAYLLSTSAHYRSHGNKEKPHCPEAAPYMVRLAVEIMFRLLPEFKKIEELHYEEKGYVVWLSKMIEKLVEAPYHDAGIIISDDALKASAFHGIFMECEGLADTHARVEDSFARIHKVKRRKKKSRMSDDALKKLAAELDVPFETLKEVFETEYSSWWAEGKNYKVSAERKMKKILICLSDNEAIRDAMRAAIDPGMVMNGGDIKCWSEKEMQKSEKVIKAFIALFLFFAEGRAGARHALPRLIS